METVELITDDGKIICYKKDNRLNIIGRQAHDIYFKWLKLEREYGIKIDYYKVISEVIEE